VTTTVVAGRKPVEVSTPTTWPSDLRSAVTGQAVSSLAP
jgi:hypothetical protein